MKKIFIAICLFTAFFSTKAQTQTFDCHLNTGASSMNLNSGCLINYANYLNTADMTILVNFHVVPNRFASPAEAVSAVKNLLNNMNTSLSNFDSYRVGGVIQPAARVTRSKIKCKLYTESTKTTDLYGGIWLYSTTNWNDQYSGKVLNIVLESTLDQNGQNACAISGSTSLGTQNGNNVIVQRDFFCHRNDEIRFFPAVVTHELGHLLGLNHPEFCANECVGIDINPSNECNSNPNCPQFGTCSPTATANNGGRITCNGVEQNLCNSCDRSNLLTSACFLYPKAMTPCQWETIFNNVRVNKPLFGLLCFTATTFNLLTSPLNDYRASQSITSTSVISGDRMVDYWAPTISLNSGFNVQLGTTFIAGPANFPCCPAGGGIVAPPIDNMSSRATVLRVIPNPFGDYIQVNYQIDEEVDNVNLTMTDITGKIVKNIPIDSKSKGEYQVEVKTNDLSNGVYFIQYQSNGKTVTQKIIKANKN
jgi:Secretion system C-terminal sorting domain